MILKESLDLDLAIGLELVNKVAVGIASWTIIRVISTS